MKVWIDFSNSPHPLLFEPIVRRLHDRGDEVLLTARDNAQTLELARERWPDVVLVGEASPRGHRAKAAAIAARMLELRRWARGAGPDVALSHNSYAQIVAARLLGIPIVTAMDYEHQPANHLAFRLAGTILLPEALPQRLVRRQGAAARKVTVYPGLKEQLYVADFEPDREVLSRLGIDGAATEIVAVIRAPPSRAIYHRTANPTYGEALERAGSQPGVAGVVLARYPEQREALRSLGLPNLVVPESAVDARSLMYAADVVVGAGGTMTREAALLGVPTISIFAGRPAAADRWLEQRGLLRIVPPGQTLGPLRRRDGEPVPLEELRRRGRAGVDAFVAAVDAAEGGEPPAPDGPRRARCGSPGEP
ncbi:MAG: DUF354 domain-containing protein [Gaiellaceae bacterium]